MHAHDPADHAEQHGLDERPLHEARLERIGQQSHGTSFSVRTGRPSVVVGDDGAVAHQREGVGAVGLAQVVGRGG